MTEQHQQLNIISHNIGGLTPVKATELKLFLDNNAHINILCIQESKRGHKQVNIPGFTVNKKLNEDNPLAGGLLTYFKQEIQYEEIPVKNYKEENKTTIELQMFKVHTKRDVILVVNVYSRNSNENGLDHISEQIKKTRTDKVIILKIFSRHQDHQRK